MRTHLKNLGQREFHPVTGATRKVKQPRLRGQKLPPASGSERRQARTRSLGQGEAVGLSTVAGAAARDAGGGGRRVHRLITLPFELPPPLAPGLKATRPEHMGTWEGRRGPSGSWAQPFRCLPGRADGRVTASKAMFQKLCRC